MPPSTTRYLDPSITSFFRAEPVPAKARAFRLRHHTVFCYQNRPYPVFVACREVIGVGSVWLSGKTTEPRSGPDGDASTFNSHEERPRVTTDYNDLKGTRREEQFRGPAAGKTQAFANCPQH
ncbi:hypothetical protein PM082_001822 [Marasmius tenuissimus]|nr:hypothetical protein PM082_001822 [Marasmius tenuissimus]